MEKTFCTGRKSRGTAIGMTTPQAARMFGRKLRQGAAGLCGIACMAVVALAPGCAAEQVNRPAGAESRAPETGAGERLGIRPLGVLLTAAGTMLEFRYLVVDPGKSRPVFDRQVKTYLVDQASGNSFGVSTDTKFGPLRSSSRDPVAGKEYFILFANPNRVVKRGHKVAIVIGDYTIEHVTVE
jgi:hypothetical protein